MEPRQGPKIFGALPDLEPLEREPPQHGVAVIAVHIHAIRVVVEQHEAQRGEHLGAPGHEERAAEADRPPPDADGHGQERRPEHSRQVVLHDVCAGERLHRVRLRHHHPIEPTPDNPERQQYDGKEASDDDEAHRGGTGSHARPRWARTNTSLYSRRHVRQSRITFRPRALSLRFTMASLAGRGAEYSFAKNDDSTLFTATSRSSPRSRTNSCATSYLLHTPSPPWL